MPQVVKFKGEFDKALAECDTALELDPYLADGHNLRGIVLEELGHPWQAMEAYRQAIRLDPNFVEARENLADLKAELGSGRQLVTIATFSYPTEAYLSKAKLQSEGGWSFVADADTVTMNWLYSTAIGGVKLQVREEDVEKALQILNQKPASIEWEDEESAEENESLRCPECHSSNVYYEKYAFRFVFLAWLILRFPLPLLKRKWQCRDCGHEWRRN